MFRAGAVGNDVFSSTFTHRRNEVVDRRASERFRGSHTALDEGTLDHRAGVWQSKVSWEFVWQLVCVFGLRVVMLHIVDVRAASSGGICDQHTHSRNQALRVEWGFHFRIIIKINENVAGICPTGSLFADALGIFRCFSV